MHLNCYKTCDVFVMGAGIAGIMAAIEAAGRGCSVILASGGNIFSGSSFYPGTWGLGLIGPESNDDEADLAATIEAVGCGMTSHEMVSAFVSSIHPAIERVRGMGVQLRRPENSGQKDFIPCFDHKHRDWSGIEFDSAKQVFAQEMERLGIETLPHCQVIKLHMDAGRMCGVTALYQEQLRYISCGAVVVASGGFGGLFKYHLNTGDVSAAGQFLALSCGAKLVNMEFMQMMPGYVSPCYNTIFNEKTFRYTKLPPSIPQQPELLEQRSTHGPFTTRLASRAVDEAIFHAFLQDNSGVPVGYKDEIQKNQPEFIKTYFDWLWEKKHLAPADTIHIGIFSHASNGGIKIAPDASTGVPGLFACGEVTGGMHGADRIGGLSTANGLVFGIKAGASASAYSGRHSGSSCGTELALQQVKQPEAILETLRTVMFENAMVCRSESGLSNALQSLLELEDTIDCKNSHSQCETAKAMLLSAQLGTAQAVLSAALLRRESRGSHNRVDYPTSDHACKKQIVVTLDSGVTAAFNEEIL